MPVQIFSGGMYHYVNAEFERALQVRRHERVITDDARPGRVRQMGDGLKVCDDHRGVCRCLDEAHSLFLLDGSLDARDAQSVDLIKLYLVVREDTAKNPVGPA